MICTTCNKDVEVGAFFKPGRPRHDGERPLYEICKVCRVAAAPHLPNIQTRSAQVRAMYRESVLEQFGKVCVCCGETEYDFLTLDHIHGGGEAERRKYNGWVFWCMVLKKGCPKDIYQVLCMNCNWAKGTSGECPHKRNNEIEAII